MAISGFIILNQFETLHDFFLGQQKKCPCWRILPDPEEKEVFVKEDDEEEMNTVGEGGEEGRGTLATPHWDKRSKGSIITWQTHTCWLLIT